MSKLSDTKRLVIAFLSAIVLAVFGLAFAVTKNYIFIVIGGLLAFAVLILLLSLRRLNQSSAAVKSSVRLLLIFSLCTVWLLERYFMTGHLGVAYIVMVGAAALLASLFVITLGNRKIDFGSPGNYKRIGRIYSDEENAMENPDEEDATENTEQEDNIQ